MNSNLPSLDRLRAPPERASPKQREVRSALTILSTFSGASVAPWRWSLSRVISMRSNRSGTFCGVRTESSVKMSTAEFFGMEAAGVPLPRSAATASSSFS